MLPTPAEIARLFRRRAHHTAHVGAMSLTPSASLGHVVCVGDSTCNRRYGGIHMAGGRATYGPSGFSMGGFGTVRCDGNGGTGTAYINCDGAGRARYKEPGAADYGAWVDISLGGCFYLPGSAANKGAIVQIVPSALPAVDTTDDMTISGSADYLYDADDWMTWLRWLVGGAAYESWKTFGITATTVAQCVASLPGNCGSLPIDTLIVSVGLNSIITGVASSTIIDQIEQILDFGRSKGARIILAQLPPASSASYTVTTVRRRIAEVNARLDALARNDVLIAPLHQTLADPVSLTGAYRTGMGNADAIHLSPQGAYVAAKATLTNLINHGWVVRQGRRPNTGLDGYDATYNPYGNRYTETIGTYAGGMMVGTAGSIASGGSGTMPTRWVDTGSSGAVVWKAPEDGSPVARTDGVPGNWFEATLPASTTAIAIYYHGYPTLTSGTYEATLDFQLASIASAGVSLSINPGGGHKFVTPSGIHVTGLDGATESESMNIRTDPIVLYASKQCFVEYNCTAPASGGAKVRIARASFRDLPVA